MLVSAQSPLEQNANSIATQIILFTCKNYSKGTLT